MAFAAAAVLALGLTGCSAAAEPDEKEAPIASEESAAPEEETAESAPTGDSPEWAAGSLDAGEKIGEITTDSWQVELYQVGTATTDKDSMFVDPDTNDNLLPSGSEVVYVNFVFTNTSDADIPLSISLGSPGIASTSWQFMGGQPSFSSSDAYETLDLSDTGRQVGGEAPFVVAPGQSFAQATNILYVPGDETEADVTLIQADDEGELLHDTKEEGETVITIE